MNNHTDLAEIVDQAPGISLPPRTVIGVVAGRPVYNIAGGSEGNDVEVDDEPESEVEEEPEDEEVPEVKPKPGPKPEAKKAEAKPGDDDYVPPSRDEWTRTQAALKKANEDAKRNRLRARELEEKTRADETEHEKALREAREQGEAKFRSPLVRAAARAALSEAGAFAVAEGDAAKIRDRFERLYKLIDTDGVSVDDDGEVSGLEAEIDTLKSQYPEFFAQPAAKKKVRPTGAERKPVDEKPRSAAERHAARVLGT
ncbi:phage scaffolding protein [Streptomyces sp. NEAU-174]|uniref:phage scaffolding protein n=1 Tax=Streptomyces sp. NEAU-174 TaxID=3458254 RepID=UPI004044D676